MRHPKLEFTRGLAFADAQNYLALQRVAHLATLVRLSPKCRPCRGFFVITGFVSHGFRRGLRFGVPPGLPATWNWSTTDRRYLPCSSATTLVNSLPGISFLAMVPGSDVSFAFVIAWWRNGMRI